MSTKRLFNTMGKIFNATLAVVFFAFAVAIGLDYMVPDKWFVIFLCISVGFQEILTCINKRS